MVGRMRWSRRGQADRSRGQAIVEFALVAPMLFLLIIGIIEAGRFVFLTEVMSNATKEGARYAIVHGADAVCPSGPMPGEALISSVDTTSCDFPGANVTLAVQDAALNAAIGDLTLHAPVWTDRANLSNPAPGGPNTGSNERGNYVTVFLDLSYRPLVGTVVDVGILPDIFISAESTLVINY
jgi:Flp pilus assembly protein TadG